MRQLGGIDNLMIEGELPNIPMHMSALMIYDTGGKRGANRLFKAFSEHFETIVNEHFPILRCRLEELPLDLDKAYWVEDSHFNAAYHITRVALPSGRNWASLYSLFAQFHALPLDRKRPLWQVTLVEGLDNLEGIPGGSTALFLKIHHAMMDGKSALRLVSSFHTNGPGLDAPLIADTLPAEPPIDKDFKAPTWWEKYGRAWWHSIERPIDLAGTVLKMLPGMLHQDDPGESTAHSPTPNARFNRPVAADRVVGHVRMDMGQLRKLEKKLGVSINDIALCVVAGALREYLLGLGELPGDDLQALMPIDVRRKGEDGSIGNHVTVAKIALGTSIKDTRQRLLAIHSTTTTKKQHSKKGGAHALLHLVDEIHPAIILWLGQWLVSSGRIEELPQTVNTAVTNVPGISSKAYLADAELIDYLGFGPLAPNMGLFHTVSSTTDHVNISFLSTAELIGDGLAYRSALVESWNATKKL
ncbi:MAG: wax ester/triacylglycerol synthase family O-acyltransferase [Halioglobus sp.]